MRSDMAKVIVERPRKKGWAWNKPKGYRRTLRRMSAEGQPIREGMKHRWQNHTKWLNEHLGPLRRYLDSQVGRPWDEVFSEICAHINRNSAVQNHVRDHVKDYVAVHVFLVDGVPCSGEGSWHHGTPLHRMLWRPWYVCPRTGQLRRSALPRQERPRRSRTRVHPPVRVSDTLVCKFLQGGWHLLTVRALPGMRDQSSARDVVLDKPVKEITPGRARHEYGAEVYAVDRRRLARPELRLYPIPVDAWR
jgi:hypothetical protein